MQTDFLLRTGDLQLVCGLWLPNKSLKLESHHLAPGMNLCLEFSVKLCALCTSVYKYPTILSHCFCSTLLEKKRSRLEKNGVSRELSKVATKIYFIQRYSQT